MLVSGTDYTYRVHPRCHWVNLYRPHIRITSILQSYNYDTKSTRFKQGFYERPWAFLSDAHVSSIGLMLNMRLIRKKLFVIPYSSAIRKSQINHYVSIILLHKWSKRGQTFFATFFQNQQTVEITTKIACLSVEKQTILELPSTLIQFRRGVQISAQGGQIERFPISVNNYVNHAGFTSKKP